MLERPRGNQYQIAVAFFSAMMCLGLLGACDLPADGPDTYTELPTLAGPGSGRCQLPAGGGSGSPSEDDGFASSSQAMRQLPFAAEAAANNRVKRCKQFCHTIPSLQVRRGCKDACWGIFSCGCALVKTFVLGATYPKSDARTAYKRTCDATCHKKWCKF